MSLSVFLLIIVFEFCEDAQRKQKGVVCLYGQSVVTLLSRFREWLRKIKDISNDDKKNILIPGSLITYSV